MAHAPGLPHGAELRHLLDFLIPAVKRLPVAVEFGASPDADTLIARGFEAFVIATGAEPTVPELEGDQSVPVVAVAGPDDLHAIDREGRVLVVMDEDGYFWGSAASEAALQLAGRRGQTLHVVTRFFELFRELPMVSRIAALRALDLGGAVLHTSMAVAGSRHGAAVLRHYLTGRELVLEEAAGIVWIGRQRALGAPLYEGAGFRNHYLDRRRRILPEKTAPRTHRGPPCGPSDLINRSQQEVTHEHRQTYDRRPECSPHARCSDRQVQRDEKGDVHRHHQRGRPTEGLSCHGWRTASLDRHRAE
jgi:hypothetical protein